jgi:hypothetical protein
MITDWKGVSNLPNGHDLSMSSTKEALITTKGYDSFAYLHAMFAEHL